MEQNVDRGARASTYTGKPYYPLSPRAEEVDILDIAHHLSMTCRYAGACKEFYSTAEHSTHMARWFYERQDFDNAKWALLHDGPEFVLGDMVRPVKRHIGEPYLQLELLNMIAIGKAFNLPGWQNLSLVWTMPPKVKSLDDAIYWNEQVIVKSTPMTGEGTPHGLPLVDGIDLFRDGLWTQKKAKANFLRMYRLLFHS